MRLPLTVFTLSITMMLFLSGIANAQTISGVVRDQLSTAVLPNIDMDVFEISNPSVNIGGGLTDGSGLYTVALPGAGTYIIRADAAPADGVADEYYNNMLLKSQATQIVVGSSQNVTGVNFDLPRGVLLSGKVTSASTGLGLALVDMDLYHSSGEFMGSYPANTVADGSYFFGAVPPGTYFILADPDPLLGQLFLRTYYGGSQDLLSATPIVVGGTNIPNINISLSAGGTISGFVTDAGTGTPVANIDIDLFDSTGSRVSTNGVTDLAGRYEIGPVPTGNYFVKFDPTLIQGYAFSFYPSGLHSSSATLVSVTAGFVTTGVDIALTPGGTISGTIVDSGSTPIPSIDLDIFDSFGDRVALTTKTDASGVYTLGPMPTGNYILRADPTILQGFVKTFYLNALSSTSANLVTVSGGFATTGVDFTLANGGTISGVIRRSSDNALLSGIDLDCFDSLGNRLSFTAKSDLSGIYKIGPLPAGNYILRADPDVVSGLASQVYLNQIDVNFGIPITVIASTDTTGIDFNLLAAGTLSGTITDQSGSPIAALDLDLLDATTGIRLRSGAISNASGFYSFEGLTPGTYKLRVDPTISQPYAMQYYTAQSTQAVANVITVTTGITTADFTMAPGTSISGTITDIVTGLPIPNIDMDVLISSTFAALEQTDKTDANGNYTLSALPLDSLLVRADPSIVQFYRNTYYIDSATAANANPVSLVSTNPMSGVDIAVSPASVILRDNFVTLDVNTDNFLTFAEALVGLPNLTIMQFNLIDTNNDGFLSINEILVNSTPPLAINISTPVNTATSVSYTITYAGASIITLSAGDITLNRTDTAMGVVSVTGTGKKMRTVTIDTLSGTGTLGISIAAGTASDAATGLADPAGPSVDFNVKDGIPNLRSSNYWLLLILVIILPLTVIRFTRKTRQE